MKSLKQLEVGKAAQKQTLNKGEVYRFTYTDGKQREGKITDITEHDTIKLKRTLIQFFNEKERRYYLISNKEIAEVVKT